MIEYKTVVQWINLQPLKVLGLLILFDTQMDVAVRQPFLRALDDIVLLYIITVALRRVLVW